MSRTALAAQQLRTPEERARSIDAALDRNMYSESGGITLWRGAQLARGGGRTIDTGYASLSTELPGGGWPLGALTEMMLQQTGIGELRLLAPALAATKRPITLVQPPQEPNAPGLAYVGVPLENTLLLRPKTTADSLWSAEQILRAGTCGALLFWQNHVKAEWLRRLQVVAKSSETLFVVFRPLAAAMDPSPAELRLSVRPTTDGVSVEVVKRKGPAAAQPIVVELHPSPVLLSRHARTRRPATVSRRSLAETTSA
ncbi:recombinase RecA [Caballeronia zhejiangensis]|uniref:Recombinase RecA n=2 Tax=Burkholderiaceae TaxID=119060 RepID=A0A656QA98_9BURK|nr:recombinase RecA [Caballeronia zhejiangensis]